MKDIRTRNVGAGLVAALLALTLSIAGCGQASDNTGQSESENASPVSSTDTYFTTDRVHSISIEMDEDDYESMLETYASTGDKEWVSVTATIDGNTFENVGLRLKGNSSLRTALAAARGITLTADDLESEGSDSGDGTSDTASPETVPWLIRLNKYVDSQNYLGRYDFVVRGNDTESSLNEAVAMAMLEEAGLATHRVAFTAFSVNGSEAKLRLVSEVPDDELWNEEWFGSDGATWKADSDGDWDYHGEDGAEYEAIWKQRTGEEDMTPIVNFMDFINNATDEEFEASLPKYLDTEEFAKYLAIEDLINNQDTISGMGNNGYLHYDPKTGVMTLIAWDHDRAFEAGGFGGGVPGGMESPESMESPEGMEPPGREAGERPGRPGQDDDGMGGPPSEGMTGPGSMGGGRGSNILETRFRASDTFMEMYNKAYAELTNSLIDSGFAQDVLDQYTDLLVSQASDLVSPEVVESDAATISRQIQSDKDSAA